MLRLLEMIIRQGKLDCCKTIERILKDVNPYVQNNFADLANTLIFTSAATV